MVFEDTKYIRGDELESLVREINDNEEFIVNNLETISEVTLKIPNAIEAIKPVIEKSDEKTKLSEEIPYLYNLIYEEYIKKEIKTINGLDPEIVKYLASFRGFNENFVRLIFENSDVQIINQKIDIRSLKSTLDNYNVIYWNSGKGYSVLDPIRYILNEYNFYNDKKIYENAHKSALEVYNNFLNGPTNSRTLCIIEELYHLISLTRIDGTPTSEEIKINFEKRLNSYDKSDRRTYELAINSLFDDLSDDSELQSLGKKTNIFIDELATMVESKLDY